MVVVISSIAKNKLVELIQKGGKSAFLYIKGGGCNGFSYKFKILDTEVKPHKLDEEYKIGDYNYKVGFPYRDLIFFCHTKVHCGFKI